MSRFSPKKHSLFLEIIAGIVLGLIIKTMIFDIQRVSGTSMEETLKDGQYVGIFRLQYGIKLPFSDRLILQWKTPKENDIVVFYANDKPVIKRCIATEKTPLDFSAENGYSLIVGKRQFPLNEYQYQRLKNTDMVPENTFLAIGDNYTDSVDSREYGFVRSDAVLGKAICR